MRLTGTLADDDFFTQRGESANEVVETYLTRGARNAQRFCLKMGFGGWRKRSAALTWSGTDDTVGGRYTALPTDFLRAYGDRRFSALVNPNGDAYGQEIGPEESRQKGDGYYFRGEQLWLARGSSPPTTLYLEYHFKHPDWTGLADADIDFPMDARYLIVAEAANVFKEENGLPGFTDMETKIERALARAREEARDVVRPTKSPRQFRKPQRFGNRW